MRAGAVDPRGTPWDVHIEWVGRRLDDGPLMRRWHERRRRRAERKLAKQERDSIGNWADALNFFDDDLPGAVFIVIAAIAAIILAIVVGPWLLALLIGAIEFTTILLACAAVIAWRTLLRRHWHVIATNSDGARHTWQVVGWRRSRKLVREIAAGIEAGLPAAAIEPAALRL